MKYAKITSVLLAIVMLFAFAACGKSGNEATTAAVPEPVTFGADDDEPIEMLAVYFPYDETSKQAAEKIAAVTGAKLFALETMNGYSDNESEREKQAADEKSNNTRPALKNRLDSLASCSVLFVCAPLWENDLPMAFYTFFEDYDLRDRIIVPFCTSDGDGALGEFTAKISEKLSASLVVDGMSVSASTDANSLKTFIDNALNN